MSSLREGIESRAPELFNVTTEHWERLQQAWTAGEYASEFSNAWANGVSFLEADVALRHRLPARVEWKGTFRTPGYDLVPADLRVDHVYLISCKYRSRILFNASPTHLFDRLLAERHGDTPSADWYQEVAPTAYHELYSRVRDELALEVSLPESSVGLTRSQREWLADRLRGPWPGVAHAAYRDLCMQVASASAMRWATRLSSRHRQEEMLWRLLRLSPVPYFVLGASPQGAMRLLIQTPWDWRLGFDLRSFSLSGDPDAGQPLVRWAAKVLDKQADVERVVEGHVEIRWSHGRFSGNPEAKVYLDTPHDEVPGYVAF